MLRLKPVIWQSIGMDSVYHLVEEPDYSKKLFRVRTLCDPTLERALAFKANGAAYCRHCIGLEGIL